MKPKSKFYLFITALLFWIPSHGQFVQTDKNSFSDLSSIHFWSRLMDYCQNDKEEQLLKSKLFRPAISKSEILKLNELIDDLYSKHDQLFHLITEPPKDDSGVYDFHFYIAQNSTKPDKNGPPAIKLIQKIGFDFDNTTTQIVKIIYYDLTPQELLKIQKEINKFPPPTIAPPAPSPMNTFQKAQRAYLDRDYEKAKHLYGIIIDIGIEEYLYDAYLGRAQCNYFQKNNKDATSDVILALKATPDIFNYELHMGNSNWLYASIHSQENNIEKSLEYLKKAAQYIESSKLYSSIAYDEIDLKKYDDALISLGKAIKLNKNEPLAYSNRSLVYLNLGKLKKARADISKSIELFDVNPYAYKHSAMIYIAEGKIDEACRELSKADQLVMPKNIHGSNNEEIQNLLKEHCY